MNKSASIIASALSMLWMAPSANAAITYYHYEITANDGLVNNINTAPNTYSFYTYFPAVPYPENTYNVFVGTFDTNSNLYAQPGSLLNSLTFDLNHPDTLELGTAGPGNPATFSTDNGAPLILGPQDSAFPTTGTFAVTEFDAPGDDTLTVTQVAGLPMAIPEAPTWAMLIFGFGLAGAAMRRGRQTTTSSLA